MKILARNAIAVETLYDGTFIADPYTVIVLSWPQTKEIYLLHNDIKYPISHDEWEKVHNYNAHINLGFLDVEIINNNTKTTLLMPIRNLIGITQDISTNKYFLDYNTEPGYIPYLISEQEYKRIRDFFNDQLIQETPPEKIHKITNAIMELEI